MAIISTKLSKDLQIEYDDGIVEGKQRTKTRNYGVSPAATDQQAFDLAAAISSLCEKQLVGIKVRDINGLAEE